MDEKDVQTDDVSKEGTTSTGDDVSGDETKTQEQPFNDTQEAKIQQMIADATSQAEIRGIDKGRREMQGVKDREVAEAQRKTRLAESKAVSYERGFGNLDEATRQEMELQRLRGQDQYYRTLEQEEQVKKQFTQVVDSFETNMTEYITGLGIDPTDKRINWGDRDTTNLTDRQKEILASLGKIQKENVKTVEDKQKQDFKDMESKLRKDLGLDSVDTTVSAGVSTGDADFQAKFNAGEIPATKENIARINKILES